MPKSRQVLFFLGSFFYVFDVCLYLLVSSATLACNVLHICLERVKTKLYSKIRFFFFRKAVNEEFTRLRQMCC
jgi:hypothetical protein